jgi:Ni2+-binding GTPase involved in maturation of urease and hydrogenase
VARFISIVAPANGSGKTSLILTLLSARPGLFTALKASTVYRDGKHCPRTGTGCACRRLEGPFTVIGDPSIIGQPETDTGRMVDAGAARTLWCLAKPGCHREMWESVIGSHLGEDELVLAEGTGVIDVMGPERVIMVASAGPPRERWKESTWPLMERSDLVVVNRHDGSAEAVARLAEEISGKVEAPVVIEDVARPLSEWADPSLARLLGDFIAVRQA